MVRLNTSVFDGSYSIINFSDYFVVRFPYESHRPTNMTIIPSFERINFQYMANAVYYVTVRVSEVANSYFSFVENSPEIVTHLKWLFDVKLFCFAHETHVAL